MIEEWLRTLAASVEVWTADVCSASRKACQRLTNAGRGQARKVYVQDRLRESGDLVWRLLRDGGHVYVCGDAAGMAPAVEDALLAVIARAQGSGRPAAEKFLARLAAAGRYQRDVWF